MCGIFGYVGQEVDLGPTVLRALKILEYRGYDSWGVALAVDNKIESVKKAGRIADATLDLPKSGIGFGHTRWATHGGVTDANAHPHLDCSGQVAVIHNGIIENFRELKEELLAKGHAFSSETDTEVIAHLIEENLHQNRGDFQIAFMDAFKRLDGLSAVIAFNLASRRLLATKSVSPLIVGCGPAGVFIASDALALVDHASEVAFLDDGQLASLDNNGVKAFDLATGEPVGLCWKPLTVKAIDSDLGGHPDFMSKEMAEQPGVLERLVHISGSEIEALARAIDDSYGTFFVGCGTASYASLAGSYLFSKIASRHVNSIVGSEFKYHEHFLTPRSLVIAMSQSGETADIIEAMLAARHRGSKLAALVNVENSTLDRMVEISLPLRAGPEQCVLSTKAYTAKVAVLLMTAYALEGKLVEGQRLVLAAAEGMREMLSPAWIDRVRSIADEIANAEHLFVIGRGLSYPAALEAALKIKEVSYIHAEGFAGGELKHGVIALVEPGTPCVVYAPNDETRSDILSGAMELRSRGGFIIGVGPENDPVFEVHVPTPDVGNASPIVQALPAQMLGYLTALKRGNDPDKPRNLAKSVTVK